MLSGCGRGQEWQELVSDRVAPDHWAQRIPRAVLYRALDILLLVAMAGELTPGTFPFSSRPGSEGLGAL